jgi:hypothetical protein
MGRQEPTAQVVFVRKSRNLGKFLSITAALSVLLVGLGFKSLYLSLSLSLSLSDLELHKTETFKIDVLVLIGIEYIIEYSKSPSYGEVRY